MISTKNKRVAVEPLKDVSAKQRVVAGGGMAILDNKTSLLALKVIFEAGGLAPGDVIYVHSNSVRNQPWANEVFELEGERFIFVPEDFIYLTKKAPSPPPPTPSSGETID